MEYKTGLEVHLIGKEDYPLQRVFGEEIAKQIAKESTDNGVVLHMKNGIKQIKGEDGKASAVILDDGTEIKADLVIIGAGVTPNTAFL